MVEPRDTVPINPPSTALRLYRSLSPVLVRATSFAGPFSAKLAEGIRGRVGFFERLEAAADRLQNAVWFHVTSVGEYEQARPLIEAIRDTHPAIPILVTHYSPSGYRFAAGKPCADHHDYLPFDHPAAMERLVEIVAPRLLIFVKFDCWPNQVLAAQQAAVPILLLAGSLQPRSARLRGFGRSLYRDVFDRFAHLGVCTAEDRRRFKDGMGVQAPVTVTGDTRVEQVILRYEAAVDGPCAEALKRIGGRLLILGSTWPPDENLWMPILKDLLDRVPDLRVVLTPHEPDPERLESIGRRLDRRKLTHVRLSDFRAGKAPGRVLLTDSIGVLAEIYRAGHLAYVGGSFTTGVHNTMEPAVAGMPVLFGPVIQNAEEAGVLVRQQAGFVVSKPDEALATALALLEDPERLAATGAAAREVVLAQRGATAKSMAVIEPYLIES